MYLTRLLSITSSGTFLIASQIPWFFNSPEKPNLNPIVLDEKTILENREDAPAEESKIEPKVPQISTLEIPQAVSQPKSPSPQIQFPPTPTKRVAKRVTYTDINQYPSDGLIVKGDKKQIQGNYHAKKLVGRTIALQLSDDSNDFVYISSGLFNRKPIKPREFSLDIFQGFENKYDEITQEQIQISLFTKPAWKTEKKKEDEYAIQLTQAQVKELFTLGMPERKLKQLLLSLTSKRLWMRDKNDYKNKPNYYAYNAGWTRPSKVDDLKNLKISYFTEYTDLKDYIQKKIDVCKSPEKSCIADISEFDTFDYDEKEFHKEALNLKR